VLPYTPICNLKCSIRVVCNHRGADVPELQWVRPGEAAAREALEGPNGFLTPSRLSKYTEKRNDPASKVSS
jgi:hypothetical protein